MHKFDLSNSELGKHSKYIDQYNPQLLFAILRHIKRQELFQSYTPIAFFGVDLWNAYEISWLNAQGKPEVRIGKISYDANSEFMVESKSLKLYLNSFNNTKFESASQAEHTIIRDMSALLKTQVSCTLYSLNDVHSQPEFIPQPIQGLCLDQLAITHQPNFPYKVRLDPDQIPIEENLYTNLLRSNCLITGQPDFGSLHISYKGNKIDHESILQYIISLRNHQEFHEQCIERIFMEICYRCSPIHLIVSGRYTRRGGIDINPIRASDNSRLFQKNQRTIRQ